MEGIPQSAMLTAPFGKGALKQGRIRDCIKGVGKVVGKMHRKHNPALTPTARMLRKSMTKEERHLWYDFLKDYPVRILRQKVIDRFIVDFYCAQAKLVIEVDGGQHFTETGLQQDALRSQRLEQHGMHVLRISNSAVMTQFSTVCEQIDQVIKDRMAGAGPVFRKGD